MLETRLVHLFISTRLMSPAAGKMKPLPQHIESVCVSDFLFSATHFRLKTS